MTDLVLVRHGESEWHAENRYAGSSDIELTARGRAQADGLARWAAGAGLDALWCSPLSRALETARRSAAATGLEPRVDDRLRELDFGRAEGRTSAEMAEEFPDALAAFRDDPVAHHLPLGESPADAGARFVECLHEAAAAQGEGRVLVVAHTTAIRLALCRMLRLPLKEYRRLFPFIHNCALTEVRLRDGVCSLLQYNAVVEDLVTPPPTPTGTVGAHHLEDR